MRHSLNRFALAAGLAISLITFVPPSFAQAAEEGAFHDNHHGTEVGGQRDRNFHNDRGFQRDNGQRQGQPVIRQDRDGRGQGIDRGDRGRGFDRAPHSPVFVGHDREHPFRGDYHAPAGYGDRGFWVDGRGIRHNEHFYCSPGWRPTRFFYYPVYGYWLDPVTGVIIYGAPAGLDPYTVVVNEVVYEQVWDPVLGQWVTVERTVPYYYTATWYPAAHAYGYVNFGGVVIYVR